MNSKKIDEITPSEWKIMRIIWTIGPSSVRKIIDMVQEQRTWSDSTIKTLLGRLVAKGLLKKVKSGKMFIYSSEVKEQTAMNSNAEEIFDQLCCMKKGKTIIDLVQHNDMSKKDIDDLIQVLNHKRKSAPEKVECDCLPNSVKA